MTNRSTESGRIPKGSYECDETWFRALQGRAGRTGYTLDNRGESGSA